jgi:hypothetical protein
VSYTGKGNPGRKLIWDPDDESWRVPIPAYYHQSSLYSTWLTTTRGVNWAEMSGSGSYTLDVGSPDYAFGPPGGLIANSTLGANAVGLRVRCVATFAPEFSLALGTQDWMHFVIAQDSETLLGTTTSVPDGEQAFVKPVANATLPLAPVTLQRELVWDGSPIRILSRHVVGTNSTQNIRCDRLQFCMDFL